MSRTFFVLVIILILGTFLRFYRLGEIPVGLHRDETFLGYNAYSIFKTRQDMSGNFLPLHLKSFLYSPAGYSYFSIPFIAVFDLSAFSVRFASALFGSLTILAIFFLVLRLFTSYGNPPPRSPFGHLGGDQDGLPRGEVFVPLLSSFLLAISPWYINLSRTATENTVVVFFISLAVLVYLLWLHSNKWYLLGLSFFCFFITLFIYQAPRAFLPLFTPLLLFTFLSPNFDKKKLLYIGVLFVVTIIVPLVFILSSKELSLRLRTVSIFATQENQLTVEEQIREDGVSNIHRFASRAFHNKLFIYSQQFLQNYFSHFSYNFLFSDKSLPDRYRIPLVGLLYILELPILLFGIFRLAKENKRLFVFLLGWIAIVPIGSALTFDDIPNLQRTLIIFPALSIVEAFGLFQLIEFIKKNYWLKILSAGLTLIFIYNISFYLHQYYVHGSLYRPWYRHDGYKELVMKVNSLLEGSKKAVVTDRESSPTIFFLFYSKYSPIEFQKETKNTKIKDFDRISFGQFEFSQEECPLKIEKNGKFNNKNIVFVNSGLCKEIPNAKEIKVRREDGSTAFRIYPSN